jgi:hypothetical protein
MIINNKIEIIVNPTSVDYYSLKRYKNVVSRRILSISVDDLPLNSHQLILVKCDICGKEKNISYRRYLQNTKNKTIFYACSQKCCSSKRKNTNLIKYGVENLSQIPYMLAKANITKLINFGGQKRVIEDFKQIHGNTYDYSMVSYLNNREKIKIICRKHGIFKQTPHSHKSGRGCPVCNYSNGEKLILNFLIKNNINFIKQKRFDECKSKITLPFDFFIPIKSLCIEFNGIQHYKPVKRFGGESSYKLTVQHDNLKRRFCESKKIKLLIIKYDDNIIDKLNSVL